MKKSKSQKRVNREILRRFAAEITRITNYPLPPDTITRAIEAVEPELEIEAVAPEPEKKNVEEKAAEETETD